jgi:hypothetical protein
MKAEHCRRIDARRWQREGVLRAGSVGSWQWTDSETGECLASIGYWSDGSSVGLNYSINGRDCSQTIGITRTPCNYGGSRPWFRCPIRGERVAVLFLRAGRFACRRCQQLAYASQSEDAVARLWRRQQRIEAKLIADWQRPKGMHRVTHSRLLSAIWDCEERREALLGQFLARLMARHPALEADPTLRGML